MPIDKFGRHITSQYKFSDSDNDTDNELIYVLQTSHNEDITFVKNKLEEISATISKLIEDNKNLNKEILNIIEDVNLLFKELKIYDRTENTREQQ